MATSSRISDRRINDIFRMFVERSVDGLLVIDAEGFVRFANPAAVSMFADKADELVGLHLGVPAMRESVELILPSKNAMLYVEMVATEIPWHGGVANLASLRDITERKHAATTLLAAVAEKDRLLAVADQMRLAQLSLLEDEKEAEVALRGANRALRTLSACNTALVRATDESALLDSICRIIVDIGGYHMAWVGYAENDPAKAVRAIAHYGHDKEYFATAQFSWADVELGRGPTGTAIRTGMVQVNQDFLTNPLVAPWREAARQRGYQSSIALPLGVASSPFGALTINAQEPNAFGNEEVKLLKELADDLGFGIETLRTRVERNRIAAENLHQQEVLSQSFQDSIKAIGATVELRDPYTAGHQRRVGQLAVAIAQELGWRQETIHGLDLAASLHDLGKISIPAEILSKPGRLSEVEFALIKTHPQAGYEIVKDVKFPWPIGQVILQHHERLDGSGYPNGLKGEQILAEAKIIAVADVVEAMASHRPYRPGLGIDVAAAEIEKGRGTAYEPAIADACLKLLRGKRFTFDS
jgi:HD-GYP domain-containing protein (c-di-GMP phosphodiesterase class II)